MIRPLALSASVLIAVFFLLNMKNEAKSVVLSDKAPEISINELDKYVPGEITWYTRDVVYEENKLWTNRIKNQYVITKKQHDDDDPEVTITLRSKDMESLSSRPPLSIYHAYNGSWGGHYIINIDGKIAWVYVEHKNKQKVIDYFTSRGIKPYGDN